MAQAANVYKISQGSVPIYIDTIAKLIPYNHINLKSQISGTVEYISDDFETGAIIKKGTVLVRLEKHDYQNEVKRLEANLAKAEANYKLELGQQEIAQTELKKFEKLKSNNPTSNALHTDLTLRKPQLEQVLSDVVIAQANLDDAKNKLAETEIKAPYDAMILNRSISLGQHVSANEALAELVSVDKYLAEVAIPVDALYNNKLLNNTNKDIPIKLLTNYKEVWSGSLVQIVSALTTDSRMGKLIISVDDPLSLEEENTKVPLLLGDQINVFILAGNYDDVIALPRNAVYNNENIWIVDAQNILHYKEIEVIWSDGDHIYIKDSGLEEVSLVLESGINNQVRPKIINSSDFDQAEKTPIQTARQVRSENANTLDKKNDINNKQIQPPKEMPTQYKEKDANVSRPRMPSNGM